MEAQRNSSTCRVERCATEPDRIGHRAWAQGRAAGAAKRERPVSRVPACSPHFRPEPLNTLPVLRTRAQPPLLAAICFPTVGREGGPGGGHRARGGGALSKP